MFQQTVNHRWFLNLAVIIIIGGLIFQIIGAWQDSPTSDENNHLAAGVIYDQLGDFTHNRAHPPLVKIIAALPVVIGRMASVDTSSDAWKTAPDATIARQLFYNQTGLSRPQTIFFVGRLGVILFWLLLAMVITGWVKSRWGPGGALLALAVFVFDPNFLGHGHLINTDVPLAAMMLTTIWFADRYFRQPNRGRLITLGLVTGVLLVTKFSAIIIVPLLLVFGLIKIWRDRPVYNWRKFGQLVAAVAGLSLIVIWVSYGFQVAPLDIGHRFNLPPAIINLRVPAASYWQGLRDVVVHNETGHGNYFNGQNSDTGSIEYFPEAFILKTPILTVALLLIWIVTGLITMIKQRVWRNWREVPFAAWLFGLPPLIYFAFAMYSNLNIGLRHIFPVYPFLFLAVGSLSTLAWPKRVEIRQTLIASLTIIPIVVAIRAWPNTIGYYNALAGGTRGGYRYLLDSNLDWGQDYWRLRNFLDQKKFPLIQVALFGSTPIPAIFPEATRPVLNDDLAKGIKPSGVLVVSANVLYENNSKLSWLLSRQPAWRIGSSILIYDFR